MSLEDFLDNAKVSADELAIALLRRLRRLDKDRQEEIFLSLQTLLYGQHGGQPKDSLREKLTDLVTESDKQLKAATELRDRLTQATQQDPAAITRALAAVDKIISTSQKSYETFYNISTLAAIEEAVKEVMQTLEPSVCTRFLHDLEGRLSTLR